MNEKEQVTQLSQAERMIKRSRTDLKPGAIGDYVAVPIPLVDRGRGDPRNIIGIIVNRDEHDMYRIAVKAGIFSTNYSRNQFDLCPQRLLADSDVNTQSTITLRQALKSSLQVGKDSFIATAAKATNNVEQTDANVLNQRSFATTGATTASLVRTRINFISGTVKNYQIIFMSTIQTILNKI